MRRKLLKESDGLRPETRKRNTLVRKQNELVEKVDLLLERQRTLNDYLDALVKRFDALNREQQATRSLMIHLMGGVEEQQRKVAEAMMSGMVVPDEFGRDPEEMSLGYRDKAQMSHLYPKEDW